MQGSLGGIFLHLQSFQLLLPAGPRMVSTKCVASDRVQLWQGSLRNQQNRDLAQPGAHPKWCGIQSHLWPASASSIISSPGSKPCRSISGSTFLWPPSFPKAKRSVAVSTSLSLGMVIPSHHPNSNQGITTSGPQRKG